MQTRNTYTDMDSEKYTISNVAALMGAHRIGEAEMKVEWLLTDSRSLCFPETTLFFALRTEKGDGHRYVEELYQRGVRNFVVDKISAEDIHMEANYLLVPNTLQALQRLAERHREAFSIPVIGIAGSNGKTTVKEWLYQMLSPDFVVTRSPRSYNSQIGVPLSVWGLWEGSEVGVFEAAISQPDEMQSLQRIIQPTFGVFTCLGSAHQENFHSMEQKCMEKLQLFIGAETLVYPADNAVVWKCVREMQEKARWQRLIPYHSTGSAVDDNKEICRIVCRAMGLQNDVIEERIKALEPVAMRLEVKAGQRGCTIINDSYNSDRNSLDIALDFMVRRPESEGRSRTLILSDIQQSGVPPLMFYSHLSQMLQQQGIGRLLAVGEVLMSHRHCFDDLAADCRFYPHTQALIESGAVDELMNEVVLVKGARSFHFEQITDLLEQKVHETILEVDLGAIVDNLNYYRHFLRQETKMVCMVKADAYGAGAVEVAKTLQDQRVDYLAVAVADEGVVLRNAGITANIMIMNPEMSSFRTLFKYNLEPEVYSFRLLKALIHEAEKEGITNFPVHIKLDTGMHRMGFDPLKDMETLTSMLRHQTALIPRTVFSHFVGSDSDDFDQFSARQYELFLKGSEALQSAFHHRILRHICNSAGIEHFPERQMEMVRLGLGLYGINSRNNQLIHNVSTLRTTILQIHDVPEGESVGYSRRTIVDRDSRIASIPIGYADGLDRGLGNRHGYCLVNGQKAPYVGNICMDVCMVDVTDVECQEGDSVLVFGEELSPSVLASITETIPYEILTGISNRVKRVYYRR